MTRSPVLFRVDADPVTGYGSFHRCQVFAAALQRRRRTAWFLSNIDPNHLVMGLKKSGNEWIAQSFEPGSVEDAENTIAMARAKGCPAVIVDLPAAETAYFEALDKAGLLVICIDHRSRAKFPKGVVINPLAGPAFIPGHSGLKYARTEFRHSLENANQPLNLNGSVYLLRHNVIFLTVLRVAAIPDTSAYLASPTDPHAGDPEYH
jgi:hypothetical protein